LTIGCAWSQRLYVEKMNTVARQMLVAAPAAG